MVIAGHDGARDHALRALRLAADMLAHANGHTFCGERLQVGGLCGSHGSGSAACRLFLTAMGGVGD